MKILQNSSNFDARAQKARADWLIEGRFGPVFWPPAQSDGDWDHVRRQSLWDFSGHQNSGSVFRTQC
jgi:hypothetical protein